MSGPRTLYLHGFASGPGSSKGTAIAKHYAERGVEVQRLDLRVPSFEHQRVSEMVRVTREAIGGEKDRAVLFGSSLGGFTAALVAERDPRVFGLVLMAPAFAVGSRWRARLGAAATEAWQQAGFLEVDDYATKRRSRIDYEFLLDAERLEATCSADGPDVRVPTLVVHGTRDDVVSIEGSRQWAKGKRHVRLVEVDDGHELSSSIPAIVREADAMLGFVA